MTAGRPVVSRTAASPRAAARATPTGLSYPRGSAGGGSGSVPVGAVLPSAGTEQRTWRLDLPLAWPLSLNAREHWRAKAKRVAQVRLDVALLARAAKVPALRRVAVELHYVPRDRRRRDPLNLVATLKPCEDGLVDAGVVLDDTPEFVEPTMPTLDVADPEAAVRLYLVIRDLGGAA